MDGIILIFIKILIYRNWMKSIKVLTMAIWLKISKMLTGFLQIDRHLLIIIADNHIRKLEEMI